MYIEFRKYGLHQYVVKHNVHIVCGFFANRIMTKEDTLEKSLPHNCYKTFSPFSLAAMSSTLSHSICAALKPPFQNFAFGLVSLTFSHSSA
jgi:hypothetical protein